MPRRLAGRGFVAGERKLRPEEFTLVQWVYSVAPSRTPKGLSCRERGLYSRRYTLREMLVRGGPNCTAAVGAYSCRRAERILKAPTWLFSSESDLYTPPDKISLRGRTKYAGDRVLASEWSRLPPTTALAHFVCTRWPSSEGRKVGMRLMRRWFADEIRRVLAPRA